MIRLTDYNSLTFKIIRVDLKTTFCLVKVKGHWTSKKTKKVKTTTSFFKMILWGSKKYFSCNFIGFLTRRMIPIIIPSYKRLTKCLHMPLLLVANGDCECNFDNFHFLSSTWREIGDWNLCCVLFESETNKKSEISSHLTFTFIVCTRHLNGRSLKGLTFNW